MVWKTLADLVLLLHLSFILFVLFGGFLVIHWPKLRWLHIPTALWGIAIEWGGWICPLTPLENWLRMRSGDSGYSSGFIEYYVLPLLYPTGLTPHIQWFLGLGVLALNFLVYLFVWHRTTQTI